MSINGAENGIDDAFINEFRRLQRDFYDSRTTPQRIGNGSMDMAYFSPTQIGPVTISAGTAVAFTVTFMDTTGVFTYNGLPAINRTTLFDPLITVAVDSPTLYYPYGGTLSGGQANFVMQWWCDMYQTGVSETSGQRFIIVQLKNFDVSSHNYYFSLSGIIPRPALKPQ